MQITDLATNSADCCMKDHYLDLAAGCAGLEGL